jgi:molybdenum cofactor guanylyltransferase
MAPVIQRSALILLGGMSTRAGGRAKYLFAYEDETFLSRQIRVLNTLTDEIVMSCRDEEQALEVESSYSYACVIDTRKGTGPVEGIRSSLSRISGELMVVVACDMPLISASVIGDLFNRIGDADVAIPEWEGGHLEPLHAVYRKKALEWFFAHHSARRMRDITDALSRCVVPVSELRILDPELKSFTNINDLQAFNSL